MIKRRYKMIISRIEAKKLNMVNYYTGKKCKNGHITVRNTKSGVCYECANECGKRWYHTNKKNLEWKKRRIIYNIRNRCKRNNIDFNITVNDLVWPDFCPVLSIKLDYSVESKNRWSQVSLDRTNPSLGYIKGNVVVMSMRANSIKQDSTLKELELLIKYLKNINVSI
jgi:hypothetical protein